MKKVVVIFVVIFALLLAGYYATGVLTERNIKQNIAALQDSNKLKIRVANYRRGFFKSDAILNVEFISSPKVIYQGSQKIFRPSNTYFTAVPLRIYHGPIILDGLKPKLGLGYAKTNITFPGHYIKHFNNKYTKESTRPELQLGVFVNFMANTSLTLITPEFTLVSNQKDSNFKWRGMTTNIDMSKNLADIRGDVKIAGINWLHDKTLTVLDSVTSSFKLYKSDFDLYLGESTVAIPAANVSQGDTKLIEVNNLDLKSNSYIDKKLFNSSLQASLDKFYINKETYQNSSIDLYIRNLDAKTLINVNNKIKRAQNGSDRQRKQAIISVLPDLPELLNKGAEFEISDFNINMDTGSVRGNFILSLPNDSNKNPFYLIQKVRGDGQITISKDLLNSILYDIYKKHNAKQAELTSTAQQVSVDQKIDEKLQDKVIKEPTELAKIYTDNKIAEMLNRGFIISEGKNYRSNIKVVQGRVIVNDKPFSMDILNL